MYPFNIVLRRYYASGKLPVLNAGRCSSRQSSRPDAGARTIAPAKSATAAGPRAGGLRLPRRPRAPPSGGLELTPGTPARAPTELPGWPRACQGTPRQLARAAGSMAGRGGVAETGASLLCPLLVAVEPELRVRSTGPGRALQTQAGLQLALSTVID